MWDTIWPYLAAIIPTICVATLFYFLMKGILEGDRRERLAQSKWEAEQDRRKQAVERDRGGPGDS
ncbi:MAG TPA: lysyl-tRNA synthetase [Dermatophilaceae bacterium]|nr:lysyl-tRNA synthetase [Dermatophilaceae bacterium]